ncbi:MAG TPA: TIGR03668 family PPOX class F420-dependent oxidoreductase [Candidatus Binataceae bacterium]|nr:TIGR03668 family PPOX class F420-dependent oxidoreductase [Candidatus Binataceae bacterium]
MIDRLKEPAVREFIESQRIAHLATASSAGAPHNIPLCFWFDGARFYFVIDEKPKRASGTGIKRMRNIAENPRVALVFDHYEENWQQLAYVLIHGIARIVDDADEYARAIQQLRHKYSQYRAMTLTQDKNPLVRIEPERVHAWGNRFQ